jgi:Zn-dependent protease
MALSNIFTPEGLLSLLYSLPAILIALSFHEFAHAWMANKMGDPTAKNLGRMTLDPIKHLDLVGTICLLLFRFGWAKPVPINPRNFKKPVRDEILVSLAGIAMNFLVSFVAAGFLFFLYGSVKTVVDIPSIIIFYIMVLNIYFGIFNLIPIPPLDGFHIISALFIRRAGQVVSALYRFGFLILLVLLLTNVIGFLLGTVSAGVLSGYEAFFGLFG